MPPREPKLSRNQFLVSTFRLHTSFYFLPFGFGLTCWLCGAYQSRINVSLLNTIFKMPFVFWDLYAFLWQLMEQFAKHQLRRIPCKRSWSLCRGFYILAFTLIPVSQCTSPRLDCTAKLHTFFRLLKFSGKNFFILS